MSHYTRHVAMIVPRGVKQAASARAEQVGRTSEFDRFDDFFSVPLSPSGKEPATHYGCHTAMRGHVYEMLPAIKQEFSGARYKKTWDAERGKVAHFDDLVSEMGLQRIQPDDPDTPRGGG